MPLQIKKLALAAALALGGVTATDVVPVLQAQAEKEVQRDGGNVKFLRAAALQGRELQREADASSVVPDAKPRDGTPGDAEPFVGRQLDKCQKYGEHCDSGLDCCNRSACLFLSEVSKQGVCGYALTGEKCSEHLPCNANNLCLLPEAVSLAEVCIDVEGHDTQLDREHAAYVARVQEFYDREHAAYVARVEEFAVALLEQPEQPDTEETSVDLIDQLSRSQFLNLIGYSNGLVRTSLSGARTDYEKMFFRQDLNSIPLRGERTATASDLGLSEWKIPENANVRYMFMTATNVPDLSHWTLTTDNTGTTQSSVYRMFYEEKLPPLYCCFQDETTWQNVCTPYALCNYSQANCESESCSGGVWTERSLLDQESPVQPVVQLTRLPPNGGMTYDMCPCINGRRCCPSLFGHGDACELYVEEQDECGSQR